MFGGLVWGGTSDFGTPKFGQILSFLSIFSYLKNFMCPAEKVKKFKFWRAPFRENPHFGTPNFVSLFFISTYTKNLIHLALKV